MNKKERKLINNVAEVLKVLTESSYHKPVKVNYDFGWRAADCTDCRAYIYFPPELVNTGNGHERTYSWELLGKLIDLADKKGISFHVGQTDAIELHIQVYVK